MSRLVKFVRKVVNRSGFDIVRISTFHRDLDEHVGQILRAKTIDAVIDVGANKGQYGRMLRTIGFKGTIYSFEPVKAVYAALVAEAADDPDWHCFDYALGDKDETKTINVYDSDVFSSFLKANDYSKTIWKSLHGVREEIVSVYRLDAVIDDLPGRGAIANFFLKMDTQGFDLQVLHGARESLRHVSALQSELGLVAIYNQATDPYKLLREFNDHGFFISGMYPINRDSSLAVIEYDVTLVRLDDKARPAASEQ